MTGRNTWFIVIGLLVVTSLLLSACNKDDAMTKQQQAYQQLSITINHEFNDTPLSKDSIYTDSKGRPFKINTLRYYLSKLSLLNEKGEQLELSPNILLIKADETPQVTLRFDSIPVGFYSNIKFQIGLPENINSAITPDNSNIEANSPLAAQNDVPMWWNRTKGYKFMVLEGIFDGSIPEDGTLDANYIFQLGTNNLLTEIAITRDFEVKTDKTITIALQANIAPLFEETDLSWEHLTETDDNPQLANKLQGKFDKVFTLENGI